MSSLFILNESFSVGYPSYILNILTFISILCGILVVITKNPITSVLFLIGLYISISVYIIFAGMHFVGISYLLVYIGAVTILFLFILMLINIRVSEITTDTNNSTPLAFLTGLYFNIALYSILPNNIEIKNNIFFHFLPINYNDDGLFNMFITRYFKDYIIDEFEEIVYVTSILWDGNIVESSHITTIGSVMYTSYSIWLIVTSLILLLAMVGAIVITIKKHS